MKMLKAKIETGVSDTLTHLLIFFTYLHAACSDLQFPDSLIKLVLLPFLAPPASFFFIEQSYFICASGFLYIFFYFE